jgi:hypothetical protein
VNSSKSLRLGIFVVSRDVVSPRFSTRQFEGYDRLAIIPEFPS